MVVLHYSDSMMTMQPIQKQYSSKALKLLLSQNDVQCLHLMKDLNRVVGLNATPKCVALAVHYIQCMEVICYSPWFFSPFWYICSLK